MKFWLKGIAMNSIFRHIALLGLLFMPLGAHAANAWEVYCYWSVDELWVVLNGISTFMRSLGFARMSQAMMLVSFAAVLFAMWWALSLKLFTQPLYMLLVYAILNAPLTNVLLIDKTGSQPPRPIANVPGLLAASVSVVTTTSNFFTESFETYYTALMPATDAAAWDSLTFRDHDYSFGSRLLRASRQMRIADPILQADMVYFTRDCINAGMAEGRLDFKRIYQGNGPTDTWDYIVANVNPARMTTYHDGAQNMRVGYCDEVAKGTLNVAPADGLTQRLNAGIAAAQAYYGQKFNKNDVTGALFATHLQNAYGVMLNASMGASEIIKQNMFLNLHNDSKGAIGQLMGNPSAVTAAYAKAQAAATANSSYLTMANLAEDTMPRIASVIFILAVALYPLVTILAMMAGFNAGAVIKNFIMALAWVALWPPLYAVVNFVSLSAYAKSLTAKTALSGGLSIQTMGLADASLISNQAVMGYMVIAVPIIASFLVKGGAAGLGGLSQSWMAPTQSASQSAGGAALGNMNQGNVSVDNANANKADMSGGWSEPARYANTDVFGNKHSFGGGKHAAQQELSSLAVKPDFANKISQQLSIEKSEHAQHAQRYSAEGASQLAAGAGEAFGAAQKHLKTSGSATNWRNSEELSAEEKTVRATAHALRFSDTHKVGAAQTFEAMASLGAGVSFGDFKAGVSASGKTSAVDEKTYNQLRESMRREEISDVASASAEWMKGKGFEKGSTSSSAGEHGTVARLEDGLSLARKGSEEYAKAEAIDKKIAHTQESAASINSNMSQELLKELGGRVGDGGAADVARQEQKAGELVQRRVKEIREAPVNPDVFPEANMPRETPETMQARAEWMNRQVAQQGGKPLPKSEAEVRERFDKDAGAVRGNQASKGVTPGTRTGNENIPTQVDGKFEAAKAAKAEKKPGEADMTEQKVKDELRKDSKPGGTFKRAFSQHDDQKPGPPVTRG